MSAVVARLVRLGAELGADALEGKPPIITDVVKQLVALGLDAVSADELHGYVSAEAAARIDAEVDAVEEEKLRGSP